MAEVQNKNGSHKNVLNLILARTLSFNVITSTKMLDGKILYLGKHNFANGHINIIGSSGPIGNIVPVITKSRNQEALRSSFFLTQ